MWVVARVRTEDFRVDPIVYDIDIVATEDRAYLIG